MAFVALLDANVLYPAYLRDALLRLAEAEIYQVRCEALTSSEKYRGRLASPCTLDPVVVVIILPASAVAELLVFARLAASPTSDESRRGMRDDAPAVLAA